MAALDDLKSRIADEIDRTDATTQIARAITTACAAYKTTRLGFNESSGSFNTVASTAVYTTALASPLPDDIVQLDTARITVNSARYLLRAVTWQEIDGWDTSATHTGRPTFYAWHAEQLRLYPTPDDAYTVDLSYLGTVEEETWATRAEALIRCRAKRELYTHFLFDPQMASLMSQAEQSELSTLKREAFYKQGSGFVVPGN